MGEVVKLKVTTKVTPDSYFGGCPHCGKIDNCLNIGREHWLTCDEHKTTWNIGSNLFSTWHDETEEDWQHNAERLAAYSVVEPIFPEPTKEERAERKASERESALTDALGVVIQSNTPIDPRDPLGFGDLNPLAEYVHRPDRLFVQTRDGKVYDLNREEAAYDAQMAGEAGAVATFLDAQPFVTAIR